MTGSPLLLDVVSFIPKSQNAKGVLLTIPDVGEATLVMELYGEHPDESVRT